MTACGNKMSGVCGDCVYLNKCRNSEIAKLPKTNIEWMREASANDVARLIATKLCELAKHEYGIYDVVDFANVFEVATEDLRQKRKATNKDWLNSMSAESFADWLTETFDLCGAGCSNCFVKEMCFVDNEMLPTEMIVLWLKQPYQAQKTQESCS